MPELFIGLMSGTGMDVDWVEAVAFAWLARQHLQGKTGNIPAVTGAGNAVVLGRRFRPGTSR